MFFVFRFQIYIIDLCTVFLLHIILDYLKEAKYCSPIMWEVKTGRVHAQVQLCLYIRPWLQINQENNQYVCSNLVSSPCSPQYTVHISCVHHAQLFQFPTRDNTTWIWWVVYTKKEEGEEQKEENKEEKEGGRVSSTKNKEKRRLGNTKLSERYVQGNRRSWKRKQKCLWLYFILYISVKPSKNMKKKIFMFSVLSLIHDSGNPSECQRLLSSHFSQKSLEMWLFML